MANETSGTNVDSIDDAFADPTPAELGGEQPEGSATGAPEATSTPNEFEGLPFQDLDALKNGYKELQRAYTQERIGSIEMSRRLKVLETATKATPATTPAETAAKQDTLERIKALLEDPDAVLEKAIGPLREDVKGLKAENLTLKREKELNTFYKEVEDAGFGKLTDDDEQALVLIIKENPWMQSAPVGAQLQTALNYLLRREPSRFTGRTAAPSKDLTSAKRAATTAAPKGGSKTGGTQKDEMDEVLELAQAEKARW